MPKLNEKLASEVSKAEAWKGGPRLLPVGRYAGRLAEVREKAPGQPGGGQFGGWSWEFRHLHSEAGEEQRGRQWYEATLSPKARGGFKAPFEAMGYTTDSDTDEMIGEWAVLYVDQEVQSQGKKAGQMQNRVTGISPFVPDEWDFNPEDIGEDVDEPVSAAPSGGGGDDF